LLSLFFIKLTLTEHLESVYAHGRQYAHGQPYGYGLGLGIGLGLVF